jgi:hypothetical protein
MPRITPKVGPVGIAITAWDVWRRLPPAQRKLLIRAARANGPKVVAVTRKHGPVVISRLASELDARRRRR